MKKIILYIIIICVCLSVLAIAETIDAKLELQKTTIDYINSIATKDKKSTNSALSEVLDTSIQKRILEDKSKELDIDKIALDKRIEYLKNYPEIIDAVLPNIDKEIKTYAETHKLETPKFIK